MAMRQLEDDCSVIVKWLSDKIFGDKNIKITITIGTSELMESEYEKLLGITFDKKLNFKKHMKDLCRKRIKKFIHLHAYQIILIQLNQKF